MFAEIKLGDIVLEVTHKDIKNIHLSVYPPDGRVKVSAPLSVGIDAIRLFATSKIGWIRQEQKKLREQERETPRDFIGRESHYVWGKRYLLEVDEKDLPPQVILNASRLVLQARKDTPTPKRNNIMEAWYRDQLKKAVDELIGKWSPILGVEVSQVFVQRMKTKWGGCCVESKSLRINTELAKKPPECLEYVVVHEMVHLLEPNHGDKFMVILNSVMPKWEHCKEMLNQLALPQEHCSK